MLELIKCDYSKSDLKSYYEEWCETIKNDQNVIYDCCLNNVYFDEFGDMPKAFVASLLSVDMNILNNDTFKDKMFVNMKDFMLYSYDKSFKVLTAKELVEYTKANAPKKWPDIYVSLRNFAAYFSINIMQSIFGTDVWVKTRRQNESLYGEPAFEYTVFSDVKTKEEISYIKEKNGVIIRTLNPSTRKSDAGISNIENTDADFIINTEGNLEDLFDKIYEIGEKIYGMFR
jgi:hypothetical protein